VNVRPRPLSLIAVGGAIAIVAILAPAPRGGAAPAAACTDTDGVTVIVDFTHFGRDIERGCAPGHPATALAAMHAAGFATSGTANYGDAFLCRIDGLPSKKSESCANTPPAKSSWSFYDAHPTDSAWTYGTIGVVSFQPSPGTILAFAFGNLATPGVQPSAAIGPPTTTPPTTTPPTTPPARVPVTGPPVTAARVPPTTAPPPAATTPQPIASPGTTTPAALGPPVSLAPGATTPTTGPPPPSTPTTRPPPSTTPPPRIVDRAAAAGVAHDSAGSPLPALIAVALVALLGIGACVTVRSRRRRST
jgi:hypothetical protein